LKRHMLANQSKGVAAKPPPDPEESPGLHKRQGIGSGETGKSWPSSAAPPKFVLPAEGDRARRGAAASEERSARSVPESLMTRPPVPSPALAPSPALPRSAPEPPLTPQAPSLQCPPAGQQQVQPQALPAPLHQAQPPWSGADTLGSPWPWQGRQLHCFAVMCKDDVEIRASPTYADDARVGHFLHPGQVVMIDDRRIVNGSCFLHLADGRGWVFETKDRLLVLTEVQEFERGLWHYSVICQDDVETRMSPTYSDDARTGVVLLSGDCIAADERCMVAGARFLKLADGRGWVFETKDRLLVMAEVRPKDKEARDFARGLWHYTVVCDDDVEVRAAPTYSDEARTGLTVHPGDCVAVDERCRVNATWFLRLSDGRGWLFETKDSRRIMMPIH